MSVFENSTFVCPSTEDYPLAARAVEYIHDRTKNPDAFVGEGGVAKVWNLAGRICVKVMEPRHNSPHRALMNLGNTVAQEFYIQHELDKFCINRVRAPRVIAYIESSEPDGFNAIVMEQMDAVDLQHVLTKKEPLPLAFDRESFIEALESFVHALHTEKRIAHGDLAPRNVMVDRATGLPIVIDFGRSKKITNINVPALKSAVLSDNTWLETIDFLLERLQKGTLTEEELRSINE